MSDTPPSLPSAARWAVLEPLLDAAIALSGDARTRYLGDACRSDVALRAELDAMLAGCDRGDRRNHPLVQPAAERFASLWEGDRFDDVTPLAAALAGRYTIEDQAGRGGMAIVYRARDLRHRRRVALKVLRATHAGHGLARFRLEIALAAQLQHPHIVPVFDSDETDGRLWYTMPFVDGESLAARLRRAGRLDVSTSVRLLREIADALAHAKTQSARLCRSENWIAYARSILMANMRKRRATSSRSSSACETTRTSN